MQAFGLTKPGPILISPEIKALGQSHVSFCDLLNGVLPECVTFPSPPPLLFSGHVDVRVNKFTCFAVEESRQARR